MRCRKTEKLLSKAVDGRLSPNESQALETHIESCPKCRLLAEEYQGMLNTLRSAPFPEAPPYFLQRLIPRLDRSPSPAWLPIGKQLGLRAAIPLALLIFAVLASAALFFLPEQPDQLSQSAALLRNEDLLEETLSLAAGGSDNPNIQMIFTSLDLNSQRRFP
jgi:anti-sigma factor RsiW